jgi:predicted transcriptional regulator
MSYEERPADERIKGFLQRIDHAAKAREIAEATDYSIGYVRKRCNAMADAGIINSQQGVYVIGHDIPGYENPTILNGDRSYLLNIIQDQKPSKLPEARSMSSDKLRKLIKEEIATATYPLGNRTVRYSS